MRSAIVIISLFVATICAIHLFFALAKDIDKDTKGIVFVKRGCLSASRESLETLRDKNSSDKDVYLIGGHPVKIEVKICGE